MGKTFFISDLHFGHKNCLIFDNRPFETIEEMNQKIITLWNNKVTSRDRVYLLGDVSWYNSEGSIEILDQLNGIKHLVKGNHDEVYGRIEKCYASISDYQEIKADGKDVVLCHYPIPLYNKHEYGAIHLYGHVHNAREYEVIRSFTQQLNSNGIHCHAINVGCMMPYMNYEPKTLSELLEYEL